MVKDLHSAALPPPPGEHHVCNACDLTYDEVTHDRAVLEIQTVPGSVREILATLTAEEVRRRPHAGIWSVTEYVCHLRDVYAVYTVRLHRTRTEDRPVLEPMLNDLRARRFRYNELAVTAVLEELESNVAGFGDEVSRVRQADWGRVATRLPGEERTALWLVRQAMHEGRHHLGDVHAVASAVTGGSTTS
jgi:uncharacterized damage-inducible protein DinB